MPRSEDLDALNRLLREPCIAYRGHKIQGENANVGTMFVEEQAALRPLPGYPFETAKCSNVRVNAFSVVRFETNSYSVPHEYAGSQVGVKVYAEHAVWTAVGWRFGRVSNHRVLWKRLRIAWPCKWLTLVFMIALFPERRVLLMAVNPTEEQIKLLSRQLRIPTFGGYPELLRRMKTSSSFESVLLELMQNECAHRQENQNKRRLKTAGCPYTKTLDELDVSRYGCKITDTFLAKLASCKFIAEKKKLVMVGNPGRGKPHLAIALGLKACSLGLNVLFQNAATLSTELCEAKDHYNF